MPNYSLVANSVFQPFTYQELAAPVIHQQQVMDNLAEQYDKLSSQADVLEAMAANENDKNSPTYARFKAYTDSLKSEADNLYRNGLDSESRMRLSELRRRYNSEIVPIQNAWTKREQEAQLQMKAQLEAAARGVDIRFSRNAADTPLQSYIENPNQTFRTINGQQLASEVANQFKGLASQIQLDRNGNPWIGKKQLSRIEYNIITQKGMDFNQFSDFMNNPDDPNYANIRGIINNTLMSHGISDFDERTQREMFGIASQGVAAGVGARDMQMHVDPYAKALLDTEIDMAKEAAKKAGTAAGDGSAFSVSEYDLPMYGANYDGSKDRRKAVESLGYRYNKDKGKFEATGKISIGGKDVRIYDNKGNLLSRDQFIKQAGSEKEKVEYQKKYEDLLKAGKTLGMEEGEITERGTARNYNTLRENSAAQMAHTYPLNYEKGDWNSTTKEYQVREVDGYKDGKPVLSSKSISLNDLLNRQDANKKDINVAAHWSNVKGNEGIILATTEEGKPHRYFIDASTMPERFVAAARQAFAEAEEAKKKGWNSVAQEKIQTALGYLHTSLTVHPKPFNEDVVKQIDWNKQINQ